MEPVKTRLDGDTNLREVRVVPKGVGYVIEIVYKKQEQVNPKGLDKSRIAGIDLGVRNIVTIANNIGFKPMLLRTVVRASSRFSNPITR